MPNDNMNVPRLFVTVERKVNLGNYEHAIITMGVSNLDFDTPDGDVNDVLGRAEELSNHLRSKLRIEIAKLRHEAGQGL